jgi:hypothetical protein
MKAKIHKNWFVTTWDMILLVALVEWHIMEIEQKSYSSCRYSKHMTFNHEHSGYCFQEFNGIF